MTRPITLKSFTAVDTITLDFLIENCIFKICHKLGFYNFFHNRNNAKKLYFCVLISTALMYFYQFEAQEMHEKKSFNLYLTFMICILKAYANRKSIKWVSECW